MKNDEINKIPNLQEVCSCISLYDFEEESEPHWLNRIPDDVREVGKFIVRLHFPCESQMKEGQMQSMFESIINDGVQNFYPHIGQEELRNVG